MQQVVITRKRRFIIYFLTRLINTLHTFEHSRRVNSVALSQDGTKVAAGGSDKKVTLNYFFTHIHTYTHWNTTRKEMGAPGKKYS